LKVEEISQNGPVDEIIIEHAEKKPGYDDEPC
jgi:hypothetical protein